MGSCWHYYCYVCAVISNVKAPVEMVKKIDELFDHKSMKMLRQYRDDSLDEYNSSHNNVRKVEYKLLKRFYAKLDKFRRRSYTFKSWQKKAIPYFGKMIKHLINISQKYRMILLTRDLDYAEMKYLGVRLATSKCMEVYNKLRKECDFVPALE